MTNTESAAPIDLLVRKMEEAKARNPRLSQRAFALKLGLSSGAFSEILQGKRSLTHQIKMKIAPKLQLSPQEEIEFFQDDLPSHLKPRNEEFLKLSTDQFHLISDWWHFALLNLVKTKGFRPQLAWLAERVGLSVQVVGDAWERLFRLGYLVKGQGHRVVRKHPQLQTTDNLFDLSIRKAHLEDLKLMENSLLDVPVHLRDQTSATLVINKSDIPKAKELIRLFRNQFLQQMGRESGGEEVYRLTISLFPLTEVMEEQ